MNTNGGIIGSNKILGGTGGLTGSSGQGNGSMRGYSPSKHKWKQMQGPVPMHMIGGGPRKKAF